MILLSLDSIYRKGSNLNQYESAKFLVNNLVYHKHAHGRRIDLYNKTIHQFSHNSFEQEEQLETLQEEVAFMRDYFREDVTQITAQNIADHVEKVIDYYNRTSWNQEVTTSDFNNYILPYKIDKEEISFWGDYFRNEYYQLNDSSYLQCSLSEATKQIHHWLYKRMTGFRFGQNLRYLDYLSPVVLDKLMIGSCSELTKRTCAYMRALGLPTTIDMTPCYLNFKSGHSWNVVVIDSTKFIPFDSSSDSLYKYSNEKLKFPKVYRQTFEPQPDSHLAIRGRCPFLPEMFNSPFYKDVTTIYIPTTDVTIPLEKQIARKINYAYLSVFTRNGWNPICWTKIEGNFSTFSDIGKGGVYLPLAIEPDGTYALSPAFILKNTGEVQYLEIDTTQRQTMKLFRKYPMDERKELFTKRMIGGIFQGANKPDFSDAYTLYVVAENPGEHYNTIDLKKTNKFRYVRYLSPPDSYCNVAEIEFYTDSASEVKLSGEIIGTKGVFINNTKSTKESAFDGNVLTYMDSEDADNIWIGLHFEQQEEIGKIRFIARNDMNAIQKGNEYELFYWDNRWISLGRQIAKDYDLVYSNAPTNALFWLKNHTEGIEERIFTYENKEQVWW